MRQDGTEAKKVAAAQDQDPGHPRVNFRGEKRGPDTHQSRTDAHSVRYRKAQGKEARRYWGGHVLMENRPGLCAEFTRHNRITEPEPAVARRPLDAQREMPGGVRPATVGADKGYHRKDFVRGCRARGVSPPVACKAKGQVPGLEGRTTTRPGYRVSPRIRQRVEEIFGWMKTVGALRRSRYLGLERTQAWGDFVAGPYNRLRLARLGTSAAG